MWRDLPHLLDISKEEMAEIGNMVSPLLALFYQNKLCVLELEIC